MKAFTVLLGLSVLGGFASATPYWVAYEGNDFPENVGWQRNFGEFNEPPQSFAKRSIEDGVFVLDALHDRHIYDFCFIERSVNPDPGELFVAEWRVLIDPASDVIDAGVSVARDGVPGHVVLYLGPAGLRIHAPNGPAVAYEAGEFHSFRLESSDMTAFSLWVDGALAHEGTFDDVSLLTSTVGFGDFCMGWRSATRWDYFRFGVVPEPGTTVLVACSVGLGMLRRRGSRGDVGAML